MPEDLWSEGRSSNALAAVVATLRVAVAVLLGGGVTEAGKLQVGPSLTTGATVQARVTAELKLFTDVTVMVAVAETPGLPEVADRAPLDTVKLPVVVPVSEYFATKASPVPPVAGCSAATVGKSDEAVLPVT